MVDILERQIELVFVVLGVTEAPSPLVRSLVIVALGPGIEIALEFGD